jgi:hypothetical protein
LSFASKTTVDPPGPSPMNVREIWIERVFANCWWVFSLPKTYQRPSCSSSA